MYKHLGDNGIEDNGTCKASSEIEDITFCRTNGEYLDLDEQLCWDNANNDDLTDYSCPVCSKHKIYICYYSAQH